MTGYYYEADGFNPYKNLAVEEYLIHETKRTKAPCLYLWQNEKTVVVGKHQNIYTECNLDFCRENGIRIVRRMTGGGAVYHDLGNLNFSIILPLSMKNTEKSTRVIIEALSSIGISAVAGGRNDILVNGQKISGNAFYSGEDTFLHHGTVLFEANMEIMRQALNVSSSKLSRHGIASVKSRVTDVISNDGRCDIAEFKKNVRSAFALYYNIDQFRQAEISDQSLQPLLDKYNSDEWNINRFSDYTDSIFRVFPWGEATISLEYDGEHIKQTDIFSDSIDAETISYISKSVNSGIDDKNFKPSGQQKIIISDILKMLDDLKRNKE